MHWSGRTPMLSLSDQVFIMWDLCGGANKVITSIFYKNIRLWDIYIISLSLSLSLSLYFSLYLCSLCIWYLNRSSNLSERIFNLFEGYPHSSERILNLFERFTSSSERIFYLSERFTNSYLFERIFYLFELIFYLIEWIFNVFERILYLFERFTNSSKGRMFLFGHCTPP